MVTFAEPSSPISTQEAYRYESDENKGWIPVDFCQCPTLSASELRLITWNLNAGGPNPTKRFSRILAHLRRIVFQESAPEASCILFQETHVDTLQAILDSSWIRDHFIVTPITGQLWTTPYGLVSLISKNIPLSRVFHIELPLTRVGRQALFIDVHLSNTAEVNESSKKVQIAKTNRTLRIANTHLEPESSNGFRIRPKQLRIIAQMLNVANVHASICAGSMVSVQDVDQTAPAQVGFVDAYNGVLKGSETWGRTPHQINLPPGRLDKILYFPTEWVEVGSPRRVGDKIMPLNEVFPSDHFGLLSIIKVSK
ncbi:hypothetical protein Clacol_005114 [Clathrus columnatus]|uniref:Endonuclease/exonuclease/phosphatase domain-containing protein n=1 Tax=Clathrus columnatus TaxID=1419009 RepID=A0AAV5AD04_9AGAM|nr:hypothetical protein Clacol_005114 [Clathrus columnatus]